MPDSNTVYRLGTELLLFVRTEGDRHLFVKTRDRVVFNVWLDEVPEGAELIVDEGNRREVNEAKWIAQVEEHDKKLAFELLAKACSWLPKGRAEQLRQEYLERRIHAGA